MSLTGVTGSLTSTNTMLHLLLSSLLLASRLFACGCESEGYEKAGQAVDLFSGGDRDDVFVLECQMETSEQREALYNLVQQHDLDLWAEGIPQVHSTFLMLLSEDQVPLLLDQFACLKAKSLAQYRLERMSQSRTISDGLDGRFLTDLLAYNKTSAADSAAGFYSNYQSYQNILKELKRLTNGPKKFLVSKFGSLGKSIDGRSIPVVHLRGNNTVANRPTIWYNHVKKWQLSYNFVGMLGLYGVNEQVTKILNTYELVIAPCINPDGYEWSRTKDRLWRKNRAKNHDGTMGVDLNRNWDSHWGEVGSSRIPGMQTYQGRAAHSEPEVRQTANYILSLKNRAAGVDVHSFGQLVMRNWGWTVQATSKESYLKRLGDAIADSMNGLYGSDYKSQRSSALYPSGGSMDDWMFEKTEMPGFTIEMRDHGEFGFVLPAEYIIPTGEELVVGILALGQAITDNKE